MKFKIDFLRVNSSESTSLLALKTTKKIYLIQVTRPFLTDNNLPNSRKKWPNTSWTRPNDPHCSLQVSAPVSNRTTKFGINLEQVRHSSFRNLHLRTRMAFRCSRRRYDESARARQMRFRQTPSGKRSEHAQVSHDTKTGKPLQFQARTKQYSAVYFAGCEASYTWRIRVYLTWYRSCYQ